MRILRTLAFSLTAVLLFVGSGGSAQAVDANQTPPEFSAELISCLKSKLGTAAYAAITAGDREATEAEFDAGDTCFEQFGPKPDLAKQPKAEDLKFAPGTEQCLKAKLGDNFRTEFASVKSKEQAKAFRSKTKDCFGKNVAGNGPPEVPADVKSCIVSAVGQAAADEMFGGKRPEKDSDLFKKVERAKCFKDFGPPPGHDQPKLSAESKACVEKVLGRSFEELGAEPTEEQKQQIGKECFGGGGPGGSQMPEAVQSCLNEAFGDQLDDLKKGPEFLTDEQKTKAENCFKKNNFHPGGPGGPGGSGGPELPPDKKACVEKIMGSSFDNLRAEPTEEQKQQIGKECFGGQGGQGGNPSGGPQGGPGANLPPDKRACVEKILGSTSAQPTEEQKQQIGKECFGGQQGGPGSDHGGGPNGSPGGNLPPDKKACVEKIMGSGNSQPTEEQKQQIGKECFGGGGPSGDHGGPASEGPRGGPGGQPGQKNDCVERITGGKPPTAEQQQKIGQECFGGQGSSSQTTPPQSSTPPPTQPGTGSSGSSTPPPTNSGSGSSGSGSTVSGSGSGTSGSSGSGEISDFQACVKRITGSSTTPTAEQQAQIERDCPRT